MHPKYPIWRIWPYLAVFGQVFERAKYGQVGCPRKDLAKCSSDALTLDQHDPPVKGYDQIKFWYTIPIIVFTM